MNDSIAQAVARLVSVRDFGLSSVVSVPVSYPSGALASVHISLSGDQCFVSDCALGLREAEMSGASEFFDRAARDSAEWFGVSYDGASVFAASAPLDRIEGAIVAVSNASTSAVGRALMRASESKDRHANIEVFEIVTEIFGKENVTKKREIAGKDATWDAHNVVTIEGRQSIFEFVSNNSTSVASKFLMFSDIVRTEGAPSLNSVVESIQRMSKKASMLGDVSNVISLDSPKEVFVRHAKAA